MMSARNQESVTFNSSRSQNGIRWCTSKELKAKRAEDKRMNDLQSDELELMLERFEQDSLDPKASSKQKEQREIIDIGH